ncbi:MAG: SMR family transporter [Bdellovibrionales bacterium]
MSLTSILLILASVALSSGSQIALKFGMMSEPIQTAIKSENVIEIGVALITSPLVTGGLFSFGLSAILWLFVLSRVPLSSAYPYVALGIFVTVLAGYFLFHEPLTVFKVAGVALILAGILLVGKSV